MQTRVSRISNIIFRYFAIFAIAFLWINYYWTNLIGALLISLLVSLILGYLISIYQKKKGIRLQLSKNEFAKIQNISSQFLLAKNKDILDFYFQLLSEKYHCKLNSSHITFDDNILVPIYDKHTLQIEDIARVFKNIEGEKITITCIHCSEEAYRLKEKLEDKQINVLDENHTFELFKKYNKFPDFNIQFRKKEKFRYSDLRHIAFTKKQTKGYISSGIIILLSSLIVPYNIYYLIIATLLFVFAGISFFKPEKQVEEI